MFAHAKALRNRPRFRWEYVDTAYCEKAVSHELCCPANHVSTIYIYTHTHTHILHACTHTDTDTCLTALCPGLPRWAGTKKAKPIWILLKQETVSGSGISWAVCKSAPRQTDNHASTPPLSFLQAGCPSCCPTNSVKALKAAHIHCGSKTSKTNVWVDRGNGKRTPHATVDNPYTLAISGPTWHSCQVAAITHIYTYSHTLWVKTSTTN